METFAPRTDNRSTQETKQSLRVVPTSGLRGRMASGGATRGFQADACYCAAHIFRDLSGSGLPRNLAALIRLCEEHDKTVLPDMRVPARMGGFWDGDALVVSGHLSLRQYYETIPHELVHALSYAPRWACLNSRIEGWRYDRASFLEAVARLVGQMFAVHCPLETSKTEEATNTL